MKTVAAFFAVVVLFLCSCDTAVSLGDSRGDGDGGSNVGGGNGGSGGNGGGIKYSLTVTASPAAGGSVSRNPNLVSYDAGTSVTATATAASGYIFNAWSGASSSTSSSITVVMNANKTLTAMFTQRPVANAVVITLTSWVTTDTDIGGCDPTIWFVVSYGSTSKYTEDLLYATDIGQSWSGTSRSSPVSFSTSAGSIRIECVVKERDLFFDDDISPGTYSTFSLPRYSGETGTATLGYGSGKSSVSYRYEFIQY